MSFLADVRAAEDLGAKVPRSVIDGWAKLDALGVSVDEFLASLRGDVGGAVVDVLAAGGDPLADLDVQRGVLRQMMSGHVARMRGALAERRRAFAEEHGPIVADTLRPIFDEAAAAIVAAREVLGDVDLEQLDGIWQRGGPAGAAWAEVQRAEQTITSIVRLRGRLGAGTGSAERFRILTIAEVPAEVYARENMYESEARQHHQKRPWDIVRRGWRLRLATPEELRASIDAVNEARQRLRFPGRPLPTDEVSGGGARSAGGHASRVNEEEKVHG